jgi:hypothetical protein
MGENVATRSDFFDFVIKEYYKGNKDAAKKTGYHEKTIAEWRSGKRIPQRDTIEYFITVALVPEFKVIQEFWKFDSSKPLLTQLKAMLGEHKDDPGIYAFYDALGNLLYLGKATKLLGEINAAICRTIDVSFPKGIKTKPETRKEVVRYISAYDVGSTSFDDYPKHVESLLLRISKPSFNKNIGSLNRARKEPAEA